MNTEYGMSVEYGRNGYAKPTEGCDNCPYWHDSDIGIGGTCTNPNPMECKYFLAEMLKASMSGQRKEQ